MKKIKYLLTCSLIITLAAACSDVWDNHYDDTTLTSSAGSLWSAIEKNSDLSNFAAVLKATGYSDIIDGSQVFTVFAPDNDAVTADQAETLINTYKSEKSSGIKDDDNSTLKTFVKNHIALYNSSVSSYTNDSIVMMNGKYAILTASTIGGAPLTSTNALYSNGVLFTTSGQVPYNYNVYETLDIQDNLDSVYQFIKSYNVYEFDADESVPGEIVDGKTVYLDSVTNLTNKILSDIGYINDEDSNYWMVVPDNDTWTTLRSEYSTYFNYDNQVSSRDSLTSVHSALSILEGTVFSMNQRTNLAGDSANSTNWSKRNWQYYKFLKPFDQGGVFSGTTDYSCSNGEVKVASAWNIDKKTTFLQPIKVEMEQTRYQKEIANANDPLTIRTVTSDNPFYGKVSNNRFVEVQPLATSSNPEVSMYIPDVLSNTPYDIYTVFVPAEAYDTLASGDDIKPSKMRFSLAYNRQNGNQNVVSMKSIDGGSDYYTTAGVVDTVLVGDSVVIPTCTYDLDDPQVYLRISSRVTSKQTSQYQKTMRIDCIIFKPHEE